MRNIGLYLVFIAVYPNEEDQWWSQGPQLGLIQGPEWDQNHRQDEERQKQNIMAKPGAETDANLTCKLKGLVTRMDSKVLSSGSLNYRQRQNRLISVVDNPRQIQYHCSNIHVEIHHLVYRKLGTIENVNWLEWLFRRTRTIKIIKKKKTSKTL